MNISTSRAVPPCVCVGRKERSIPLWTTTASELRHWLREQPHTGTSLLFPNRADSKLSRTNVTERLQLAVRAAAIVHSELAQRKVTPHIFRHYVLGPTMSISESESGGFLREFGFARYEVLLADAT